MTNGNIMGLITDESIAVVERHHGGLRVETYQTPLALIMSLMNSGYLANCSYGQEAHVAALNEIEKHLAHVREKIVKHNSEEGGDSDCDEDEELIQQCIEVIRSEEKAAVALLQRRLRLGYTRAARIMDELELRKIVGPSKGAEPRDILIDLKQS
jgi:DNA segregation ATPase FtsK/SpoIIIE-like protein